MRIRRTITCVRCRKDREHAARGLCYPCWRFLGRDGARDAYPGIRPRPRTLAEAGQAIENLAAQGLTLGQVAERLGYKDRWVVANMRYRARKALAVAS